MKIKLTRDALIGGVHAARDSMHDLDADTAATLISHGIAVDPNAIDDDADKDLAEMTVAELKAVAIAEGIDIGAAKSKAAIIDAIEEARAYQ